MKEIRMDFLKKSGGNYFNIKFMEELLSLLKQLPSGSENVIPNLIKILKKKYPLLKNVNLNDTNFKIIYLGDIQIKQKEFWRDIVETNKQIKTAYDTGKSTTSPYPDSMLEEFWRWWSVEDRLGKKMRCEYEKFWQIKSRLSTWFRRGINKNYG